MNTTKTLPKKPKEDKPSFKFKVYTKEELEAKRSKAWKPIA